VGKLGFVLVEDSEGHRSRERGGPGGPAADAARTGTTSPNF
jgi:hypothetical protein